MTTTITDLDDFKGPRPVLSHHREGPRRHCGWWALLRPADRRRHLRLHHHDSRLPKARRRPQGRRRALPPLRHHDRPRPMSRPRGPSRHQDRRRGARVRLRRPSRSDRGPYTNRYISVLTITDRKVTHWRDYLDPVA